MKPTKKNTKKRGVKKMRPVLAWAIVDTGGNAYTECPYDGSPFHIKDDAKMCLDRHMDKEKRIAHVKITEIT